MAAISSAVLAAIYEQARTALHQRLGNDPQISDAALVNEHYRLEVARLVVSIPHGKSRLVSYKPAIYEVEEDLLLSGLQFEVGPGCSGRAITGAGAAAVAAALMNSRRVIRSPHRDGGGPQRISVRLQSSAS